MKQIFVIIFLLSACASNKPVVNSDAPTLSDSAKLKMLSQLSVETKSCKESAKLINSFQDKSEPTKEDVDKTLESLNAYNQNLEAHKDLEFWYARSPEQLSTISTEIDSTGRCEDIDYMIGNKIVFENLNKLSSKQKKSYKELIINTASKRLSLSPTPLELVIHSQALTNLLKTGLWEVSENKSIEFRRLSMNSRYLRYDEVAKVEQENREGKDLKGFAGRNREIYLKASALGEFGHDLLIPSDGKY